MLERSSSPVSEPISAELLSGALSPSDCQKSILLTIDIDYTLINSLNSWIGGVDWIGGLTFWTNLLDELDSLAEENGCRLIVAIVTARQSADPTSSIIAKALRKYLEKHNPSTYRTKEDGEWCLKKNMRGLFYINLENLEIDDQVPAEYFSHFHFIDHKPTAIKEIAAQHDIHTDFCLHLDDKHHVLNDAEKAGIRTVSFDCFGYCRNKLDDETYISENIKRLGNEIFEQFQSILAMPYKESDHVFFESSDSEFSDEEPCEPCGSFREIKTNTAFLFSSNNENLHHKSKVYYMIGGYVLVKNVDSGSQPDKYISGHIRSCIDNLREETILSTLPASGNMMLFGNPIDAFLYIKYMRIGNLYLDHTCWQPVVFDVKVKDRINISVPRQCIITFTDVYNNLIETEVLHGSFFTTPAENINPQEAILRVNSFIGTLERRIQIPQPTQQNDPSPLPSI